MPQTTTIETVTIVRPLKVLALICLIVALILLIVALAAASWLRSDGFRTGLFEECREPGTSTPLPLDPPEEGKCQRIKNRSNNIYVQAVAALLVIAGLCICVGVLLTGCGLRALGASRKFLCYRIALGVALFAVVLELIALIVFPVCFYQEMASLRRMKWDFDWAYGVGWGATLFTFGACLLLICDKEHEEVYYKEKTVLQQDYRSNGMRR